MKKPIFITFVIFLSACTAPYQDREKSTDGNTRLLVDKETHVMSRAEVATAVHECESMGMRPIVINARRKVNGIMVPAPVDVSCMPKYKP